MPDVVGIAGDHLAVGGALVGLEESDVLLVGLGRAAPQDIGGSVAGLRAQSLDHLAGAAANDRDVHVRMRLREGLQDRSGGRLAMGGVDDEFAGVRRSNERGGGQRGEEKSPQSACQHGTTFVLD